MVVVDKVGVLFRKWMGELYPNSHFTLNNSTFYIVRGGLSDLILIFEA